MANWDLDMLTAIYARAEDSVNLINTQTTKKDDETEEHWKERIKRNWEHLEIIKGYKQIDDGTTSVWVDKRKDESNNDIEWDWTAVDAAITKGKSVQA
tara:strand:- start:335 stop:628 length:294 start_codon:yes stop_codon:yes gene_type:complete